MVLAHTYQTMLGRVTKFHHTLSIMGDEAITVLLSQCMEASIVDGIPSSLEQTGSPMDKVVNRLSMAERKCRSQRPINTANYPKEENQQ